MAEERILSKLAQPSPGTPHPRHRHMHTPACVHTHTHTYTPHARAHTPYLPFSAFLVAGELKQCDGVVELPELERGEAGTIYLN